jgi:hypothetical protein
MKRMFFGAVIIAITAFSIAAAFSAEPPKLTLTINECLLALQGFNAIDEHLIVIGEKPHEQTVKQSYEYGPGGFRINVLAHNIHALTQVQQDAQAEQQKIFRDILAKMPPVNGKPAAEIPAGTPEAMEYDAKLRDLTSAPCTADLVHFRDADLHLDKNELPAWALSNLEKLHDK